MNTDGWLNIKRSTTFYILFSELRKKYRIRLIQTGWWRVYKEWLEHRAPNQLGEYGDEILEWDSLKEAEEAYIELDKMIKLLKGENWVAVPSPSLDQYKESKAEVTVEHYCGVPIAPGTPGFVTAADLQKILEKRDSY